MPPRRIAALFRPFTGQLAVVVTLIVASPAIARAAPFLLREVIDSALPNHDLVVASSVRVRGAQH